MKKGSWRHVVTTALAICLLTAGATAINNEGLFSGATIDKNGTLTMDPFFINDYGYPADITIPDKVVTISDSCFASSQVQSVTFNGHEKKVGASAFSTSSLRQIAFPDSVTEIGMLVCADCTQLTDAVWSKATPTVSKYAFDGCTALQSVTLPEGVTAIDSWAFKGCTALTSIRLPATLRSIENAAFENAGLKSIVIPDGVTKLGWGAFEGCTQLTELHIPASVTEIGLLFGAPSDPAVNDPYTDPSTWTKGPVIYGVSGSEAERYARKNGIRFMTENGATQPTPEPSPEPAPEPVPEKNVSISIAYDEMIKMYDNGIAYLATFTNHTDKPIHQYFALLVYEPMLQATSEIIKSENGYQIVYARDANGDPIYWLDAEIHFFDVDLPAFGSVKKGVDAGTFLLSSGTLQWITFDDKAEMDRVQASVPSAYYERDIEPHEKGQNWLKDTFGIVLPRETID